MWAFDDRPRRDGRARRRPLTDSLERLESRQLLAFTGVGRFPARIKCALLGWAALRDAIVKAGVHEDVAQRDAEHEEDA